MLTRLASLAVVLALSGCKAPWFIKADPYAAECSAECFHACPEPIKWPKWTDRTADQCAALLELDGQLAKANAEAMAVCEARRDACARCLDRLATHGVITAPR